jgi:hypothetical protein
MPLLDALKLPTFPPPRRRSDRDGARDSPAIGDHRTDHGRSLRAPSLMNGLRRHHAACLRVSASSAARRAPAVPRLSVVGCGSMACHARMRRMYASFGRGRARTARRTRGHGCAGAALCPVCSYGFLQRRVVVAVAGAAWSNADQIAEPDQEPRVADRTAHHASR